MKKAIIGTVIALAVVIVFSLFMFFTKYTCDSCAAEKYGFNHSLKIANGKPIHICTSCYNGVRDIFE